MEIRKNELLAKALLTFFESNERMLKRDFELIINDVSERCICANLKEIISFKLKKNGLCSYFSDVEYNRVIKKHSSKRLPNKKYPITCDLIIHSRGNRDIDNLICLEMKKDGRDSTNDVKRLKYLTSHNKTKTEYISDYLLGILYCVDCNKKQVTLRFFKNGHEILSRFTINFSKKSVLAEFNTLIDDLTKAE